MVRNQASVRIIGGRWRGTRIELVDDQALRPSSDRTRERVFNWLSPWIAGASVLDLFAGSGAFGFEAVSRGAAKACLVEQNPVIATALEQLKTRLKAEEVAIHRRDARQFLRNMPQKFDLVFVDPPFTEALLQPSLEALKAQGLASEALIYVEAQRNELTWPCGFEAVREGQSRQTSYALLSRKG